MTQEQQQALPNIDDMPIETGTDIRKVKGKIQGFSYPTTQQGRQQMIQLQLMNVEVLASKPNLRLEDPMRKFLYTPEYIDIHPISKTHKHIGLVYFLRTETDAVRLAEEEHTEIRWFTEEEFNDPQFNLELSIKFYAREAIHRAQE